MKKEQIKPIVDSIEALVRLYAVKDRVDPLQFYKGRDAIKQEMVRAIEGLTVDG